MKKKNRKKRNIDGGFLLVLLLAAILGGIMGKRWKSEREVILEEISEPAVEFLYSGYRKAAIEEKEKPLSSYGNCLINEEEKSELENLALLAADKIKAVYEGAESEDDTIQFFYFTDEQQKEAVRILGQSGFVSVAEDVNMENYEKVEDFYSSYLEKHDALVTIFEVNREGRIGAYTFIYREDRLQTFYVGIKWQEGKGPQITDTLVSDVAEITLTEKGYFIYAYESVIAHSSLRQYWRIRPLSDKCRELTAKYIKGLSYLDYNILSVNWNGNNVEEILEPCIFEDVYRIITGNNLQTENGRIPAKIYEKVMTTGFPVSEEQLRNKCGYDMDSDSYPYEMIFESPYQPFGEVTDYTENKDGTLTLHVEGVWPDYNSDCAFVNEVTVLPFQDGTFRFLSNTIEKRF